MSDQSHAGPRSTGTRLRAVAPPADVVAARLRERVRASLVGHGDDVRVGRYVLGDRLGAGGMGTVYRGRDHELRRDVAIKLVPLPRPSLVDRAVQEARAMAGIVHPNVVEVFDVGIRGDELFIVMQLMEGSTLRAWAERERSGAELLDALLAAGEGLAAAHAAGIVHHDFKPNNVLVTGDGRIAVTDFGLAAARDTVTEDGPLDHGTTEDGPIGGTPGYAAQERRAGRRGDARSDQYSWCVAAHELLFGALPRPGEQLAVRSSRAEVGRVPRRLRRALRRGLSEDPALRFPDLRTLLDACRPEPRRPIWMAMAAVATGTLGLGSALVLARPDEPPRAAVAAEHVERELPIDADADAGPILQALDAYDEARLGSDPAEALHQAERARALVDALGVESLRAEVGLAEGRALEAVGRYEDAAAVLSRAVELAQERGDDGLAARAASALSWVLGTRLHEPGEARRWAKTALIFVDRGGDLVDAAAIHYSLGNLAVEEGELELARGHLEEAIAWDHGELSGNDHAIALSHMAISNLDLLQGDVEAARASLDLARSLLAGVGDDGDALANVHSLLGEVAHMHARYGEALDHHAAALAIYESTSHPLRAYGVSNSARVLHSAGRHEDAIVRANEALRLLEEQFGEMSIETTTPLAVLAAIHRRLGDLEQAESLAWRTVVVLESAGRSEAPSIAGPLLTLGEIVVARGEAERGIGFLERSLEIRRRHGVRPAAIAATLMAIARARAEQGRRAVAVERAREAIATLDAAGEDSTAGRRFVARLGRGHAGRPRDRGPVAQAPTEP